MLGELNKSRYRALELLAEHVRAPSRELSINAIVSDISDEDLRWVTDRIHYYLLKLLEDAENDPIEEEIITISEEAEIC
jgi:DNA-binding transcriptional ArsR family regulator|tara:strand:+ start:57 stop:293 length:237 start_codon:yes stop_codon:yes gene_type:complete